MSEREDTAAAAVPAAEAAKHFGGAGSSLSLLGVHRFLQLTDEIKTQEAKLKALKNELDSMKDQLLSEFEREGTDQVRMGSRLVYVHEQVKASVIAEHKEAAAEALRKMKLDGFVHEIVNAQQLSAYVRELREEEKPIPGDLAPLIRIWTDFDLRVKKA